MIINVSIGEVVDKITILEIKLENIKDEEKRTNVLTEYNTLNPLIEELNVDKFKEDLRYINNKLWDIEDKIREKERDKEFDDEFVELARSVYYTNDIRAQIKRDINVKFESDLIEEKSYESYK